MKMKVAVMKCRVAVLCDRTGVITILHGDVTPGHTALSVRLLMIMVALARDMTQQRATSCDSRNVGF